MAPAKRKKSETARDDDEPSRRVSARGASASQGEGSQRTAKAVKAEKVRRRVSIEHVDLEEDEEPADPNDVNVATMTQQYQSQLDSYDTQAVVQKLSVEEKDKLVSEVMRLMLFSQYRDGAPVRRTTISELITSLLPMVKRANVTAYVVAQAQVKFNQIFGYEMKELDRVTAKKGAAARTLTTAEPQKEYVLKSMLPAKSRRRWIDQSGDLAWRGFCVTVCSLVSISGGQIEEQALWKHLASMGVHQEDEVHPKLGNPKAALARLLKQRYLLREKIAAPADQGGDLYGLSLAERALDELGKNNVDAFVRGVMEGDENEEGAAAAEDVAEDA